MEGIEITSSEDNKIRIQIKYVDDVPANAHPFTKVPTNIGCDNAGITRVATSFSGNVSFNEKPIDVPDDFEWNAQLRAKDYIKPHRKKVTTSVRHLNPLKEFLQVSFLR